MCAKEKLRRPMKASIMVYYSAQKPKGYPVLQGGGTGVLISLNEYYGVNTEAHIHSFWIFGIASLRSTSLSYKVNPYSMSRVISSLVFPTGKPLMENH